MLNNIIEVWPTIKTVLLKLGKPNKYIDYENKIFFIHKINWFVNYLLYNFNNSRIANNYFVRY